jgi:hypothetical protein
VNREVEGIKGDGADIPWYNFGVKAKKPGEASSVNLVSQFLAELQGSLFPKLEEELGPLGETERRVVRILSLVRIEEFVYRSPGRWVGRPEKDRRALARAFVAKKVAGAPTTRIFRSMVEGNPTLRRICGWERRIEIPSEATFSRAFAEFARTELADRTHQALIKQYQKPRLVGHISRDSTAIRAREKATRKARPAKRTSPTRLQRQLAGMTLAEMLEDVPRVCDWGRKRNSGSKMEHWKGYKLHVDWADGGIPTACLLTAASVHDSQVAIPLATMTAERVTSLYDLMDAGYDAKEIREHSRSLGHVPIIDVNRRSKHTPRLQLDPASARRYNERTTAERGYSRLLDSFGGRTVRVRGASKVMTHLMFGILALTADQILRLSG